MKMPSIADLHTEIVEQLKERGEGILQLEGFEHWPDHEPNVYVKNWDTEFICGHALKEKDGTYSIHHDFFCYYYSGFKLEDLGLCDAYLWYQRDKIEMKHGIKAIGTVTRNGGKVNIVLGDVRT